MSGLVHALCFTVDVICFVAAKPLDRMGYSSPLCRDFELCAWRAVHPGTEEGGLIVKGREGKGGGGEQVELPSLSICELKLKLKPEKAFSRSDNAEEL